MAFYFANSDEGLDYIIGWEMFCCKVSAYVAVIMLWWSIIVSFKYGVATSSSNVNFEYTMGFARIFYFHI